MSSLRMEPVVLIDTVDGDVLSSAMVKIEWFVLLKSVLLNMLKLDVCTISTSLNDEYVSIGY